MRYLFQEYQRHLDEWEKARSLKRVRPKPEEAPDGWIDVGIDTGAMAVNLRIMHMLSELGCTAEQRRYYGPRFFFANRFIGLNMERLTKEWLVLVEDGAKAAVTNACSKAVLEAIEPEPMPNIADVDLEKVIARGRELLKTGFAEPSN
jgi:hypothetical protein